MTILAPSGQAERLVLVDNQQTFPSGFSAFGGTGSGIGLFSLLLLGLLPPLLFRSPTTPALAPTCPTVPPCPTTVTTPCPTATTCPAKCVPMPTCPAPYIKLSNGGTLIENKCFYFSAVGEEESFRNALIDCHEKGGGTLLNIQTMEEGQAVYDHLLANYADELFIVGYADVYKDQAPVGFAGGPNPVPVFGEIITGNPFTQNCVVIEADLPATPDIAFTPCGNTERYICEIDLSLQNWICP